MSREWELGEALETMHEKRRVDAIPDVVVVVGVHDEADFVAVVGMGVVVAADTAAAAVAAAVVDIHLARVGHVVCVVGLLLLLLLGTELKLASGDSLQCRAPLGNSCLVLLQWFPCCCCCCWGCCESVKLLPCHFHFHCHFHCHSHLCSLL